VTPVAVAASSLLLLLTVATGLSALRRYRSVRHGLGHPRLMFDGLAWLAIVTGTGVVAALLLTTVIVLADPAPMVERLFPGAAAADTAVISLAFQEVLATAVSGLAASVALGDLTTTFVGSTAVRRLVMAVLTLGVFGFTTYGALFVCALIVS